MAAPGSPLANATADGPDAMGREIAEGPDAVEATLAAVEALSPQIANLVVEAGRIVLVGTGASLAVIRIAAPIWRGTARHGVSLLVRQATEVALGDLDGAGIEATDVVVAISQSGSSPETLAAARLARAAGASVLALTAHPVSALASIATLSVPLASGEETGAATKSALASLAAVLAVAGCLRSDAAHVRGLRADLVETATWTEALEAAELLAAARHTWMLGFGAEEGIAAAAGLLWQEKVIRPATAATPSEFRHGLIEAVAPQDVVLLLSPLDAGGRTAGYLGRLRGELRTLGVAVLELRATAPAPGPAALELLFRVQHLARATALAAGTYREQFAILRRVVKPADDLFG
jgi:fructoselysine-6-P-deglycase FrlB-like protein